MAASLEFAAYLGLIASGGAALAERAESAGSRAPVPTCPDWSVAELVAHQGMVHRWAAANLRNEDAPFGTESEVLDAVAPDRLIGWFRDGVRHLVGTLSDVAADVETMVFLVDAGPPRDFWARRQTHETTIHAVDAMAAALGRVPRADEVAVDRDTALDGIDELVCGFMPRKRRSIRSDVPFRLAIVPSDSDRRWTLRVGPDDVVSESGGVDDADAMFAGTAAQLYLGIWNRGDELTASGIPGVLEAWRTDQQVR